ncbi:hypothetical protein ACET3Z_012924 [Daucus carota]
MHENIHAVKNGGLIISQPKKLYLADYESLHDDVTNPIEIGDPVIKSLLSDAKLVGSVNGLVCFCLRNYDVILMNPSTRKWITLPVEPHELRRKFFNHDFGVLKGGFGYDHVSDDYKFVKLRMSDNPFGKIIVTVYSARTNSWKHIRNARLSRNVYLKDEWGMFAGGALYWKARDFGKKSERGKGSEIIVGFDLGLGRFRAVASDSNCWSLRDFGGYLYTLDNSKSRVDVFQRNYHSAENPWSTAFSIMGRNVFGVNGVRPLMYSESLGEVLILVDCKRPVWYHLESGFGYDHVSDDYKFVKLGMSDNPLGEIFVTVYSVRTNSWTHIRNASLSRDIYLDGQWGRFAGGALYWKARILGKKSKIIVGFDLWARTI